MHRTTQTNPTPPATSEVSAISNATPNAPTKQEWQTTQLSLPPELWGQVLPYLSLHQHIIVGQASKWLNVIANSLEVWNALLKPGSKVHFPSTVKDAKEAFMEQPERRVGKCLPWGKGIYHLQKLGITDPVLLKMISEGQADVDQILQTSKDIKQLREGGTLSDEKVRSLDEPEVQAYYEANPTCLDDIMNLPDWTLLALARDSGIANPDETAKEINWVGRTFTYEQIKNFTHVQCLAVCNEGIQKILQKCPTPESMVEKLNSITSEVVPDDWNLDPWFGLTLAGRVNN